MSTPLILVVEDDPKSRKLLLPEVILMDIRLPGMSGIDALRCLRNDKRTSTIPVIAVTASVMHSQIAESKGAGFDAVEYKPVNVQSLLGIVGKFTGHKPVPQPT
jgi:CheY-like chemotaxis protein